MRNRHIVEIQPDGTLVSCFGPPVSKKFELFGRLMFDYMLEGHFWYMEESEDIASMAARCGLAYRTTYDPVLHENMGIEADPGDEIWIVSLEPNPNKSE